MARNRPMGGQLKPWDGKSPISIAAAVLYLITSLPRATRHPTTLAIAEASGVAEVRNALRPVSLLSISLCSVNKQARRINGFCVAS